MFEGKFGVYHSFLGIKEIDLDEQLSDLGERWETPRIAYKPYPACHFIHGSLGATASLAAGRTFTADEIDAITVRVPEAGVALVLEPETQKRAPRSEYEGKFSLQYSTAAMLGRGSVGIADYTDDAISDQSVLDIAAKVSYETKGVRELSVRGLPRRGRDQARQRRGARGRARASEGRDPTTR